MLEHGPPLCARAFHRSRARSRGPEGISPNESRPGMALVLLDLRGDGSTRIGAPTYAVHAQDHSDGAFVQQANAVAYTQLLET